MPKQLCGRNKLMDAVTGINFFFSYGVQFAQSAGLANTYVFQIILASVNVAASFPGIYLVDRAGRRPVLLIGAATMFIGQIVVGSVSKAYPDDPIAGDVLIAFTCLFVAVSPLSQSHQNPERLIKIGLR